MKWVVCHTRTVLTQKPHRNPSAPKATVTTATALYAMTITIANVALPQIQGALSATQDQIAWIVTFNIVATAVGTPMTGWLTARFGQRRVMLYAVLGFSVATLMCGLAGGLIELVLYRIAQGLFGAPLAPLSQAIVSGLSFATLLTGTVNGSFLPLNSWFL